MLASVCVLCCFDNEFVDLPAMLMAIYGFEPCPIDVWVRVALFDVVGEKQEWTLVAEKGCWCFWETSLSLCSTVFAIMESVSESLFRLMLGDALVIVAACDMFRFYTDGGIGESLLSSRFDLLGPRKWRAISLFTRCGIHGRNSNVPRIGRTVCLLVTAYPLE